jgi:hypothetical protein
MTLSRRVTELLGDTLRASCKATPALSRSKSIYASVFAIATDNTKETLLMLNDLVISPILESDMPSEHVAIQELCYKLAWERILETSQPGGAPNEISNCKSETLLKFAALNLDSECSVDYENIVKAILDVFDATLGPKAEVDYEL